MPTVSARSRIVASIVGTAAIGLAVAGLTTFVVQRDRIVDQIDDRLLSRVESARVIATGESTITSDPAATDPAATDPAATDPAAGEAAAATPATGTGAFATTREALEAVLAQLIPDRNESAVGMIDGRATFIPGVDIDFRLDDDPAFLERVVGEVADGSVRIGTAETSVGTLRYIATPVTVGTGGEVGIYITAVDINASLADFTDAFETYFWVALIALLAIALVGWLVAGRLLRPIQQLRRTASTITASERTHRVSIVGSDDVSLAGASVNNMLDRLDLALTSQRQLLDDVRHELKTPITIVRGHLELLDARNVDEVESARVLAIDELDRMSGLVDDIEALAEAQTMLPELRRVAVADFTTAVFTKASGLPGHKWLLGEVAEGAIDLDPRLVTQAWLQLVDNAAKYSPAWSEIVLGSSLVDGSLEFWVEDQGGGIPPGSEGRIFERFGRVDSRRGIRGSGLGLPIVMAIATAHGGTVSLETSPVGSRFGIVVPLDGLAIAEDAPGSAEPVTA